MVANYLVCYDIKDERRLARVYRYMKARGIHLQYSVFHCRLSHLDLIELENGLKDIIDEGQDDVRIYPLPGNMEVVVMGCGDRVPEGVMISL